MRLIVNGIEQDVASPPLTPLLHVLRDELDITSPKAGCQAGGCGTCTVLVDGEPRRSCLTALAAVDGAEITTLEGLGEADRLTPVQAAFYNHYGAQCGFCTPGMVIAATALLERKGGPVERDEVLEALGGPDGLSPVQAAFYNHYAAQCGFCTPGMIVAATHLIESKGGPLERDEVLEGLAGHYCRCTGYVKIVDAVLAASRGESTVVDDLPTATEGEPEVQPKGSPA